MDTTSIGYHQKKERIIAKAKIDMETNNNSYNNKEMIYIVDKPSKEKTYNNKGKNTDTVHNNDKVVGVTNHEYGNSIFEEGGTETDEENEKDVVEANVVEKKRDI